MPTSVLEEVEVLGLYGAIRQAGYGPVLCFLAFRRSQEIDWSRYGDDDPLFFGNDFKTGQMYDIPPLRANKRSKTGSGVVVDTPGHEVCWLKKFGLPASRAARLCSSSLELLRALKVVLR